MASVLVVNDDPAIRQLITKAFAGSELDVIVAGYIEDALAQVARSWPDVVLLDVELPDASGLDAFDKLRSLDPKMPVIYITDGGSSDMAIEAMKLGAFDYLLKPLDIAQLRELVGRALHIRRLMKVPVALTRAVSPEDQGDQIIGRSPAMQEVFKAIGRVASQDATVLIRGESGTGKELVARAIYQHSGRRDRPFLAVNCAAIPDQLLESELFGHERGSFTGADRQRIGKFEQCNGGMIFLDEIGDMPTPLQGKILRVLQQQEFQRVGGNTTIRTNVRIVAATNRDLESMVAEGTFREDLLYRLNGFSIYLPSLSERGEDLILLVQHILARLSREVNRNIEGVAPEAMELLKAYRWPGNVRELEGVLRQTLLQATGTIIVPDFLPPAITSGETNGGHNGWHARNSLPCDLKRHVRERMAARSGSVYADTLEMMERFLLTEVLSATRGNQSEAARILGITRGSLRHKIRLLGISIESKVHAGG